MIFTILFLVRITLYIPKHTVPFPVCPPLQVHDHDPELSVHVAFTAQLCRLSVHSSMLEHDVPLPV